MSAAPHTVATMANPWTTRPSRHPTPTAEFAPTPVSTSPVPLIAGEELRGRCTAQLWRYSPAEVTYGEPFAVGYGGPLIFTAVAAAAAIGRRNARRHARTLAAAQWRPHGHRHITATTHRLLIHTNPTWTSLWFHTITSLRPGPNTLTITVTNSAPFHFAGSAAPWLADRVVVADAPVGGPRTPSL